MGRITESWVDVCLRLSTMNLYVCITEDPATNSRILNEVRVVLHHITDRDGEQTHTYLNILTLGEDDISML